MPSEPQTNHKQRSIKLGLAMVTALLLLVDAEIVGRFRVYGFHFSWLDPENAGVGHRPGWFIFVDAVVGCFFLALNVGLVWIFWQLRTSNKSARSPLLRHLLGDEKVIVTEKDFQDFKYKSGLIGVILPKGFGLMLILFSFPFINLHRLSSDWPYLLVSIPILLLLWSMAGMILLRGSPIEIGNGQFRFYRFFTRASVPYDAISDIRAGWLGVYVTVEHRGMSFKVLFGVEDEKLGPSPPPVIQFLEEVCRRNATRQEVQA